MTERSLTPNITVTIGHHTRIYFAFVTTAPTELDSPATVTLHAATFADVVSFAAEPITLDPSRAKAHARIVLVDAMPDPPRVEPSAPEPWAASGEAPEDEPEEGRESVPSREREEVLVSANAGALDAVAGVATAPGAGEGFTSVPQRTDHELPLPPPPFGSTDPHARAKRLARALVSDIVVYNSDRRERSVRMGTVRQEFREEIRKSWEEYVAHVGNQLARDTSYFRDALNELLAGGNRLF